MNEELLDKLKFQAAAQVSPLLEGSEWQQVYSEKFAELIVRECLDIVDDEGCGEGGSIRAINKIKQHFGVEE